MIDPAIYTKLEEETQLIAHLVHAKLLSLILSTWVAGHGFFQPEWEWEGFSNKGWSRASTFESSCDGFR